MCCSAFLCLTLAGLETASDSFLMIYWDMSFKTNRVFSHMVCDVITDFDLSCLDSLVTEMTHASAGFGSGDMLRVDSLCISLSLFQFLLFVFWFLDIMPFLLLLQPPAFLSTSVCNADYPCEGMSRHATFENFGMAFLTLFQVSTGDNWNGIMKVQNCIQMIAFPCSM